MRVFSIADSHLYAFGVVTELRRCRYDCYRGFFRLTSASSDKRCRGNQYKNSHRNISQFGRLGLSGFSSIFRVPGTKRRSRFYLWYGVFMKRSFYIASFALLGLLLSTILHSGLEIAVLNIIFSNPDRFFNTFWWNNWSLFHMMMASFLWFLGIGVGIYLGCKWWLPYGSKKGFLKWGR